MQPDNDIDRLLDLANRISPGDTGAFDDLMRSKQDDLAAQEAKDAAAVTERRHLLTQDATLAENVKLAVTTESPFRTWLRIRAYRLDIIHIPRPRP